MSPLDATDVDLIVREIDETVKRRRASGGLPAELEAKLDLEFARFAPAGAGGTDINHLLARMEQRSHIEINPPLEDGNALALQTKRTIRRVVRWYVRAIAEQASAFDSATTRAMRLTAQRLDRVEAAAYSDAIVSLLYDEYARILEIDSDVAETVVQSLRSVTGRVLQLGCGDGWLLEQLQQNGITASGVEPSLAPAEAAVAKGLDVRSDDIVDYLAEINEKSLGGIVLTGFGDFGTPAQRQAVLSECANALDDGGVLVVLSAQSTVWNEEQFGVVADLALGRPFVPATWIAFMNQLGIRDARVHEGNKSYSVIGTRQYPNLVS